MKIIFVYMVLNAIDKYISILLLQPLFGRQSMLQQYHL